MSATRQAVCAGLGDGCADNALPLAILVLASLFALAQPAFLKPDNLIGIVRQVALIGIMACCMTFVIMTGGVDLSVGPVLALAGLVSFFCLDAGLPLPLVILAGAGGRLRGRPGQRRGRSRSCRLPPIIVTLAMLTIVRGTALIIGGTEQHLIRDQPGLYLHRRGHPLRPAVLDLSLRAGRGWR